jgi:hypothetical protein
MKDKPKMTRTELTRRVNEEAKRMRDAIKNEGGSMTFNQCKIEAKKVFEEEYEIIK